MFIQYTTPGPNDPSWSNFAARLGPGADAHRDAFEPGAHHWQLWPGLDVRDGDLAVEKKRFSAFVQGSSELHDILQDRGIDTVIVSGTMTNCCCESTARDAMQNNYRVIMAADAMAALSDEEHAATLHILGLVFADLRSVDELETMLAVKKAEAA